MKQNKNEELHSRREFFKKSARKALPILAIGILGPSFLASCDKDEPDSPSQPAGCNGCSGSCSGSCAGSCEESCSAACAFNCGTSQYYG